MGSFIGGLMSGFAQTHIQQAKQKTDDEYRNRMLQASVLSNLDWSSMSDEEKRALTPMMDQIVGGGKGGKSGKSGKGGVVSQLMDSPIGQKMFGGGKGKQQPQQQPQAGQDGPPRPDGLANPVPQANGQPMAAQASPAPVPAVQGAPRQPQAAPQSITPPPSPNGVTSQSGRGPVQMSEPPSPGAAIIAGQPNRVKQAQQMADFDRSQIAPNLRAKADAVSEMADKYNLPPAAKQEMIEAALGMPTGALKAVPKGFKAMEQGGAAFGIQDQDTGKQYLPAQLTPTGDAPPEAKSMWGTIIKQQADKQAATEAKEKAAQDKLDAEEQRQRERFAHEDARVAKMEQNGYDMADYREQLTTYRTLDTSARQSVAQVQSLKDQYAQPGNKAVADNELQNFYTTVVQKGGRKTAAELALTTKIGSWGMNAEMLAKKAATGELPDQLRKDLLHGMEMVAKEQQVSAQAAKPERPDAGSKGKTAKKAKSSDGPPSPNAGAMPPGWN